MMNCEHIGIINQIQQNKPCNHYPASFEVSSLAHIRSASIGSSTACPGLTKKKVDTSGIEEIVQHFITDSLACYGTYIKVEYTTKSRSKEHDEDYRYIVILRSQGGSIQKILKIGIWIQQIAFKKLHKTTE